MHKQATRGQIARQIAGITDQAISTLGNFAANGGSFKVEPSSHLARLTLRPPNIAWTPAGTGNRAGGTFQIELPEGGYICLGGAIEATVVDGSAVLGGANLALAVGTANPSGTAASLTGLSANVLPSSNFAVDTPTRTILRGPAEVINGFSSAPGLTLTYQDSVTTAAEVNIIDIMIDLWLLKVA